MENITKTTVHVKIEPVWEDSETTPPVNMYAKHIKLEPNEIETKPQDIVADRLIKQEIVEVLNPTPNVSECKVKEEIEIMPMLLQKATQTIEPVKVNNEMIIPDLIMPAPQSNMSQDRVKRELECKFEVLQDNTEATPKALWSPAEPQTKASKAKRKSYKRKLHSCDICHKTFTHLSNVQTHQVIHTGERAYSCDICKKSFTQLINLKTHKLIHTGIKKHACKVCKWEFTQLANLKSHEITHTGAQPYSCDICEKRFTRSDTLKTHKQIHTGVKTHSCDVCEKRFIKACDLTMHKRIHTGQKPYACDECVLRFTQKGNLMRHKKTHLANTRATDLKA